MTNSANPRYPCRLESAIAHTFARKSTNRETSVAVHQRQPEAKPPGEDEQGEEPSGPTLTCLRSACESPDMPKKLVASAPVTRPSPSAAEPIPVEQQASKPPRVSRGGAGRERRRERLTWIGEGEPLRVDPLVLLGAGHAGRGSRDLHLLPPHRSARPPPPPPRGGAGAAAAAQVRQEPDGPPPFGFPSPSGQRRMGCHFETGDPTSRRRSPVISFNFLIGKWTLPNGLMWIGIWRRINPC